MSGSQGVSRNDFVKVVTGILGAAIAGVIALPAVGYFLGPALNGQSAKDRDIEAGPLENYPEGVPTLFTFNITKVNGWERTVNSYGVYVVRKGEEVKIFSNVCTHLSCRVKWQADINGYHCPCHDGVFDIDGGIVRGPQPRPLDQMAGEVRDGTLFILFSEDKKE